MKLMDVICKRQSCRNFLSEQIGSETLSEILKAANAAPISMGQYENMYLTVVQNVELLNEIDGNAAKFFANPDMRPLYNAPTLIIVSSITGDKPFLAYANAACIIENMLLTATANGLGSVFIYGAIVALNKNEELINKLCLPKGFTPISAMAVGKSGEKLIKRDCSIDKLKTSYIK